MTQRRPELPPLGFGEALLEIRARGGKNNRGAPAYSRWINRPLGRLAAAFAATRGMTPNQLTAINAALIFPVLFLLPIVRPSLWWSAFAAFVLLAGYALDSADGQLARFRGGGTMAGQWLDHVSDALKTALFHAVIAIAWFRFYEFDSAAWLLIPIGFGVVHSTFFFSLMLADDLRRFAGIERGLHATTASPADGGGLLQSLIKLPNDWGTMCLALVLMPAQWAFVAVYAFLFVVNVAMLLLGWVRWYRQLAAL